MNNFKVSITKTGELEPSWVGFFETEAEANEWLDAQKLKVGRREERVVVEAILDSEGNEQYTDQPVVDESGNPVYQIEYTYDDEGNVLTETVTDVQAIDRVLVTGNVTLPAEATYLVEDVSAVAARLDRLRQLEKDAAKNVNDLKFGRLIIALVGKKNEQKDLAHTQKNEMMADPNILVMLQMLGAGRIGYAKDLLSLFVPDGTLVTQADKDDILQLMEDYLA